MSIFAVTALILAIPAGFVFRRLDYKKAGLIAIASMIAGSLIGLTGTGFWALLLGRFIEGIGKCFMGVVAPAIIAIWLPTGIYATGADAVQNRRLAGLVMAMIAAGQNTGILLGPLLFGWILDSSGSWRNAFLALGPVSALGAFSVWMMKIR